MSLVNNAAQPAAAAAEAAPPSLASTASPTASAAKPKLDTLPNEALLRVWVHLDEPTTFAWTNQRFHALSQDTVWRAKWLMQRYELYEVIYEAIARPLMFSPEVLDQLILAGAPLTRNVAQLLLMLHNELSAQQLLLGTDIAWGKNLSFPAFSSVLSHAAALFGSRFSSTLNDFASLKFTDWMSTQKYRTEHIGTEPEANEWVRSAFEAGHFMPLEVSFVRDDKDGTRIERRDDDVTQAIIYDAELLAPAVKNGYLLTSQRAERIIDGWCKSFKDGEKAVARVKKFEANGIHITEQYVQGVFEEFEENELYAIPCLEIANRVDSTNAKCDVLMYLDKTLALSFRLHDVVTPVALRSVAPENRKRKVEEEEDESDTQSFFVQMRQGVKKKVRRHAPSATQRSRQKSKRR